MENRKQGRNTACQLCKARKRKCIRQAGLPCTLCQQTGRSCSAYLDEFGSANGQPTNNTLHDYDLGKRIYNDPLLEHYVELFFQYIHDPVLTVFHKPTFMLRFHNGEIKHYILYGIAALAIRFSNDPSVRHIDPRNRGANYYEIGIRLLKLAIDEICIDTIHGCMLFAHYASGYNQVEQEAVYVGVAIRMAHILHLQEEPDTGNAMQDEVLRRAWSILFAADRWSALGNRIPRITGFEYITHRPPAKKPMPDIDFLQLMGDEPSREHPIGIWGPNRDLHDIGSNIHKHQLAVLYDSTSPEASFERIDQISSELQMWQQNLPPHFKFTPQNIYLQSSLSYGAIFLGTHLSYHYNYVVLLYQFLSYSDPQSKSYGERLEYHASQISEIIRWSNRVHNCQLLYSVVAHILVISSSVHLHTLMYGNSKAVERAKENLDTNFEHIMALRRLWPAVDVSAARLRVFESACLVSNQNTWRMDRWLVKFLLFHTKDMNNDQRDVPDDILSSSALVPNQPGEDSNYRMVEHALSWLLSADPATGYPQDLFIFDPQTSPDPTVLNIDQFNQDTL
ncbi:hypothetical protein BJV82DRAFT_524527 [Fennellomyces sp. T-0311]|nr:hypothetical protein BJV82DRAFT_524527 [Fennellomyces sp. T-0311]